MPSTIDSLTIKLDDFGDKVTGPMEIAALISCLNSQERKWLLSGGGE